MTGRRTERTSDNKARLRALQDAAPGWRPQLGDLAHDIARSRSGVVVDIPDGAACLNYHLRPPNGGDEWSAAPDASTLRPAYTVTHATPARGAMSYDARAKQGALPIVLHHEDGTTEETILIASRAELADYAGQLIEWLAGSEGDSTP